MKLNLLVSSALLALASAAAVQSPQQRKSYDGYKVVRLTVGKDAAKVNSIIDRLGLSTWKGKVRAGAVADIVIPPSQVDAFAAETAGMEAITMHEDLGASIAAESTFQAYAAGSANATWFQSYHSFNDHLQFLNDLQQQFSTQAEIVSSGKSLNGRDITGIHFWGKSGKGKPAVVFHGTVHAREWISTMVVEYLAYYLLNNQDSAEVAGFLDKYDFFFFPFVNPDGFVYTQTNDRLWRKNRQSTSGSSCIGHDINRNWPYKWDVSGGASTNPCAEDFKGTKEADAPETQALSAWLKQTKESQGIKLFIDWHSYSQLFMTPYGYSCTAVAPNNSELQSLAQGAAAAIKAVHGTSFKTGPICSTIYKATGSSVDYANDVVGADYVFTAELRDTGNYGFVLPASQILPSGEETYAGVRYLLQNMK
ncbi:carboxypeptidase [Thermothelomyces thermophilus ATCC 42464]|uniref:Carboxypeptidase n=1 Tax=Thermothelomyces thermophilus (strain ATCC 42464 / BCRC 31852 / DSM 1799) TaxID=573729 RepID=G2Q9Z6_THET4|nr:carboxypeptidase [Thermothelomyces thermophilus ATCC 42464]AEO56600.1 carboxypeptidase [Thermothelomyces thermophilus ATCC 42464]